jgi:prepilin-type N-terminal cleavage/methylation domain-containing protein
VQIMKNKKGFTLIELLVVVLIIGILAAIALPQYRIAIEKSRASEAFILGKSIVHAAQMYNLTNGSFSFDLRTLDVSLPSKYIIAADGKTASSDKFTLQLDGEHIRIARINASGQTINYYLYTTLPSSGSYWTCNMVNNSNEGRKICISLGGTQVNSFVWRL